MRWTIDYVSPTIATLKKYATAVGCKLEIRLVRATDIAA